jgi:hypothetical protein
MKKSMLIFITALIVASFFLTAFLAPKTETDWPDPTASAITGDTVFSLKIIPPTSLPGTYLGNGGMILPSGFPEGEVQFGGKGLSLLDVSDGTEQVCFSLPTYSFGWRGNVYEWNGSKWVKFETSTTFGKDGAIPLACAKVFGNGTYALLINFDPKLAPVVEKAVSEQCISDMDVSEMEWGSTRVFSVGARFTGAFQPEIGSTFTWKVVSTSPSGFFTPTSGTGTVVDDEGTAMALIWKKITTDYYPGTFSFVFKIYMPECHLLSGTWNAPIE